MNNNKLTLIKNALKSTLTSISPSAELVNKLYLDSHLVAIKISKTIQEKYSLSWDTLKLLYVAKDLFLVYYTNISSYI
jgi:transcriptional regulatory protein LevR